MPSLPSLTAVVVSFPTPSQTFILRKLHGLRDAGMPITVAASMFGPEAHDHGFDQLQLLPWSSGRIAAEPRSRRAWSAVARAAASSRGRNLKRTVATAPITAVDTDIVHFEFSGIAVSYLEVLPQLRERARIVVSCRGAAEQIEPLKDPRRRDDLARVFELSDLIHCVSDDMASTVEAMGAPTERILVNRPAVPVADYRPLRARSDEHDGPFRVLSIGRLHWKKGLDDGIRAIAAAVAQGASIDYRIVGEGPEREKLQFLIHELDLGDAVTLLGAQSAEEVRAHLAWSDALLLPSWSEGISNAVLEAMAAGRPVVTTDCGGMTEVVTDGVDGLVVPVGDVASMTDRLLALAGDPATGTRLAEAAARTADSRLDISHQIDRFVTAYTSLAGR